MAAPRASDLLGTTTLITGVNEFLAERTISAARAAVRAVDADADICDLSGSDLGPGALAEITSPSLFASRRSVAVRALEEVPDATATALVAYAGMPAPDVHLMLHHTGGAKGRALLEKLRTAGAIEVKAPALKKWELPKWVMSEFRSLGAKVDEAVATALVDALGEDLRGLAGAVDQLVSDAAGEPITAELVRSYFGGRADVKGFAIADAALEGKEEDALEQLRWALSSRVDPVLVTSAVASGLRSLARYVAAPRGLREADLAREVGVPPWKLRSLATQSRGWSPHGLALAIQAAATADADVKGAAGDRLWTCERLVISVVEARGVR